MDEELLSVFRHHRHDVLNGLQLVRGYIQLNKPNDALKTLDYVAKWLQSLTAVQALAGGATPWFCTACASPHVRLAGSDDVRMNPQADAWMAETWAWLEQEMAQNRIGQVDVRISEGQPNQSAMSDEPSMLVGLVETDAVSTWWEHESARAAQRGLTLYKASEGVQA